MWWMRGGSKNIRYLQSVASSRKRINRLKEIRREDGTVVEEGEVLTNFVRSFFQDLFTSSNPHRLSELIDKVQLRVTSSMRAILEAEYTREEVKAALDHIGDLKAPGPDGFPARFFQGNWGVMKDEVTDAVINFFEDGIMPEGVNETVIVLIPKGADP